MLWLNEAGRFNIKCTLPFPNSFQSNPNLKVTRQLHESFGQGGCCQTRAPSGSEGDENARLISSAVRSTRFRPETSYIFNNDVHHMLRGKRIFSLGPRRRFDSSANFKHCEGYYVYYDCLWHLRARNFEGGNQSAVVLRMMLSGGGLNEIPAVMCARADHTHACNNKNHPWNGEGKLVLVWPAQFLLRDKPLCIFFVLFFFAERAHGNEEMYKKLKEKHLALVKDHADLLRKVSLCWYVEVSKTNWCFARLPKRQRWGFPAGRISCLVSLIAYHRKTPCQKRL